MVGLWGVGLVVTYPDFPPAYQARVEGWSLVLLGAYLVAAVLLWLALEFRSVRYDLRTAGFAGLVLDTFVTTAITFAFGFDGTSAVWIIVFLIPVEGAMRFQLRGAVLAFGVTLAGYVAREIAWSAWLDDVVVEPRSIIFRMVVVGVVTAFVGLMSEQLRAEREIARAALVKVQRSDEWRSHLVSALGHDVRSPLATIEMQAQALARMQLTEAQRDGMYEGIERQARRLARLADGLLDMALAEQAKLELRMRPVALAPLVDDAIELVGIADQVQLDIEDGLEFTADPDRLTQIILNLLGNARKYGEPPIDLRAHREGGEVVLSVRDHGTGIDPSLRETLFQAFARGEAEGSIGLGLYLVFTIAAAHGGRVDVEDAEPGARFVVHLPAGERQPAATPEHATSA